MAVASQIDLQTKITSLRRAPVPKPPVDAAPSQPGFVQVKLRKVNANHDMNSSNKSEELPRNNNGTNVVRKTSVKDKAKIFNDPDGPPKKPPVNKPPPPKKPTLQKPPTQNKPFVQKAQNGSKPAMAENIAFPIRSRPPSVTNKPSAVIQQRHEDDQVPEASPLPPLFSLGDPPTKPPKLWSLKRSLEKYIGTSHPPRPTVTEKPSPKLEHDKRKPALPLPTEAPPIPFKPVKTDDHSEENVEKVSETVNTDTSNQDSMGDDFYDDTTGMDITVGTTGETFGEDIYEPVTGGGENEVGPIEEENYEELPAEKESAVPPTLPPYTDKKNKEHSKEEKKKKEKEEKERRKKDKEEKEKGEKDRKKREKEKEKKLSDMKRRFSVRGNETALGTCTAAIDIPGNKMDISATIGEEFDVIRKDKTPNNKWLVRNKQGQYGFIDIKSFENDGQGEDIYEEVSVVKESMNSINEHDIPLPPKTSPPPPPNTIRSPDDQEIYDDVAAGEELYEPLDN